LTFIPVKLHHYYSFTIGIATTHNTTHTLYTYTHHNHNLKNMMSLALLLVVCFFASTVAFRASSRVFTRNTCVSMSQDNAQIKPKNAMKLATGLLSLFSGAIISTSTPVYAATYGGFGKGSPLVLDPKASVLNTEANTEDVKAALTDMTAYTKTIVDLKEKLLVDGNVDVSSYMKDLGKGKMRTTLNKFNTAFDEETQKGTDRLIRNVLQDLTELDRELSVKNGKKRAEPKVEASLKRLEAAETSLNDLAAFYNK
jgi:hypothetical protein